MNKNTNLTKTNLLDIKGEKEIMNKEIMNNNLETESNLLSYIENTKKLRAVIQYNDYNINDDDILIFKEMYKKFDVMTLEVMKNIDFNSSKEFFERLILGLKSENFDLHIKPVDCLVEDCKDEDEDDDEDNDCLLYIYTYNLSLNDMIYEIKVHSFNNKFYLNSYKRK